MMSKSYLDGLCCIDKAAADANAAAWAAYYAQYQQQPQAPMTPTNAARGTTQTTGQGQQGQQLQDYTKAWEEYYKKQVLNVCDGHCRSRWPTDGCHPDYSAAWAEYYRQQAAYYGQSGSRPMGAAPQAQQLQQASRQQSDKTLTKLFSSYTGLFISLLGMGGGWGSGVLTE
ncbi:hypothetical protein MHYP_G00002130 [Metynnis hypsauchen]